MLKHFLGLQPRAATIHAQSLIGAEPIASIIDKRRLPLFINISRLQGSVENKILSRKITMKSNSSSLAATAVEELNKYDLPNTRQLIENPIGKQEWANTINNAVNNFWYNKLSQEIEIETKPSLKYLQLPDEPTRVAHNIWKTIRPNTHDVTQAEIKARCFTGTYILQTYTAKFNQLEVDQDGTSPLCGIGGESM